MTNSEPNFHLINNMEKPDLVDNRLFDSSELKDFFIMKNYTELPSISVENTESDTVFITAGAQTAIQAYKKDAILDGLPIFISQPVIRTQFFDSIDEGTSIAFTNISTVLFDGEQGDHDSMVSDWLELLESLGIDLKKISTRSKGYERVWGKSIVSGEKTFYSYNGIELGDSAYLNVESENDLQNFTLSDIGFGLERIRWVINGGSYFDLPNHTLNQELNSIAKGTCSALALLAISGISPSNKGAGYRFRQLSKRLVKLKDTEYATIHEELEACLDYWKQLTNDPEEEGIALCKIIKENHRNTNRLILDVLLKHGFRNGQSIDINLPREEFLHRLSMAGGTAHLDEIFNNNSSNMR